MVTNDLVKVGYIGKPHGFKGQFKITLEDGVTIGNPQDVLSVFIQSNEKPLPYFVESFELTYENFALLKLDEVNSKEEAALLKGKGIFLNKETVITNERLAQIEDDYIGFKILDTKKGELGIISEIMDLPSHQVAVLQYQNNEILLPLTEHTILEVKPKEKELRIKLPKGLLDIYQ